MRLPRSSPATSRCAYYPAGHMIYTHPEARSGNWRDEAAFFTAGGQALSGHEARLEADDAGTLGRGRIDGD